MQSSRDETISLFLEWVKKQIPIDDNQDFYLGLNDKLESLNQKQLLAFIKGIQEESLTDKVITTHHGSNQIKWNIYSLDAIESLANNLQEGQTDLMALLKMLGEKRHHIAYQLGHDNNINFRREYGLLRSIDTNPNEMCLETLRPSYIHRNVYLMSTLPSEAELTDNIKYKNAYIFTKSPRKLYFNFKDGPFSEPMELQINNLPAFENVILNLQGADELHPIQDKQSLKELGDLIAANKGHGRTSFDYIFDAVSMKFKLLYKIKNYFRVVEFMEFMDDDNWLLPRVLGRSFAEDKVLTTTLQPQNSQEMALMSTQEEDSDAINCMVFTYPMMNKKSLREYVAEIQPLFDKIIQTNASNLNEFLRKLGELSYHLYRILPLRRGSASVIDWLVRGIAEYKNIELGQRKKNDLPPDFQAFVTTDADTYGKWFAANAFSNPAFKQKNEMDSTNESKQTYSYNAVLFSQPKFPTIEKKLLKLEILDDIEHSEATLIKFIFNRSSDELQTAQIRQFIKKVGTETSSAPLPWEANENSVSFRIDSSKIEAFLKYISEIDAYLHLKSDSFSTQDFRKSAENKSKLSQP